MKLFGKRGITIGRAAVLLGLGLVLATRAARLVAHPSGAVATVLIGSLPNFGAGLALPFVVTNLQQFFGQRPWLTGLPFCLVSVGAFAVLVLWEYVQLAVWQYPFDTKDIVASEVGVALAVIIATWSGRRREVRRMSPMRAK